MGALGSTGYPVMEPMEQCNAVHKYDALFEVSSQARA